MFLTRSEYDRGVNTFSPEGRLFQVEYAIEAVKLGSTSIGIRTKEGVVIASESRSNSKLIIPESVRKISQIDKHIAVTSAGLIADARMWVDKARTEAQNYWFTYNRKIRVEDVTQTVANLALHFGDDDSKITLGRPFGVAMLFAGVDVTGPQLFHLDPSGTFTNYRAKAIGAACDGAEQSLRDQYKDDMSLIDAEKLALTILKQVMEEKLSPKNVEIATITCADELILPEKQKAQSGFFHLLSESEIQDLIAQL